MPCPGHVVVAATALVGAARPGGAPGLWAASSGRGGVTPFVSVSKKVSATSSGRSGGAAAVRRAPRQGLATITLDSRKPRKAAKKTACTTALAATSGRRVQHVHVEGAATPPPPCRTYVGTARVTQEQEADKEREKKRRGSDRTTAGSERKKLTRTRRRIDVARGLMRGLAALMLVADLYGLI